MPEEKSELHAAINRAVAKVLGVDGSFPHRAGDWVFVHEIPNGNWDASGQTIGIREINPMAGGASAPTIMSRYWQQSSGCVRHMDFHPPRAVLI